MRGLAGFFRELVLPRRDARAIPLGRLAIGCTFVFVALFVLVTLRGMGVQLPFVSHPFVLQAEFSDAAGLSAGNEPQVSVAGVPEGQVTGVALDGDHALVTMSLDPSARGRVFRNATVRVRPFNGANFLQVDILPGTPAAGALPARATIGVDRTSIPVNTDQVLDVLNADTRAYLQILTEQAAAAFHGAGGTLARALERLAPLSGTARQIGAMLAQRRTLIAELVGESNDIFRTLAQRHAELADVVAASGRILSITAGRRSELALATRRLPAVLGDVIAASRSIDGAAPTIDEALLHLAPAAAALAGGLHDASAAVPGLDRFLSAASSLTAGTLVPSRELERVAGGLSSGTGPAITSYQNLTTIVRTLIAHAIPIRNFSDALSGVLSTQDDDGVIGRVKVLGVETPQPADLGLSASTARVGANGHSQLETLLALALDGLCHRGQPLACVIQVATPGLPGSVVPRTAGLVQRIARLGGSR